MSKINKAICDACGKETNSKTEVVRNAENLSFVFNQSNEWKTEKEVVKQRAVTVKIFIECEGKEDFHLCYDCLGSLCGAICDAFSEECDEDGDC